MTAKELKVGQTVKYGNVWVKIETLFESKAKNGRPVVSIIGTQLAGVVKHAGFKPYHYSEIKGYEVEFRAETKVKIK